MSSRWVKFQPSSTPPSDRFWWGVLVLVLVVVVIGVKQSQLLVLRLSLEFDKKIQKKNKKYFEKIDVKTLGQLQISLVKQGSPLFIAAKR